jgi:patatin-related protein
MSDSDNLGGIISKEIRFAVVMYGGVSLAIYINGVAQELLKMVRATSPENAELKSTEKIYHKIACLLSDKKLLEEVSQLNKFADIEAKLNSELNTEECSSTRFVVDIVSGTSAGGINGVFLAKALARNQNIDELKKLWLNEGDIDKLINDKKSVKDINLSASPKSKSLLNSRRMYLKLLDAVDGMEEVNLQNPKNPLVNEVDLFVTVTDFKGVSVPLRLLDRVVYERRYRHVFHFQHSAENDRADFAAEHSAMLAFAARCTSAFPFAFEPMRLSEAFEVIDEACPDANEKIKNLKEDRNKFFTKVKHRSGEDIDWTDRDLVDGGYLDNKPFSYAIDALSQRRADYQVERKLIYIEPSPENLNLNELKKADAPDALQNAKAAITELPRYETIREDLQRVLERNRLIERINRLTNSAEKDIYTYLTTTEAQNWKKTSTDAMPEKKDEKEKLKPGEYWQQFGMENIIKQKGPSVLPYYRLRISSLTDDIARLVTRKVGFDTDSEYFRAIYALVNAWRGKNYAFYLKEKGEKGEQKDTVLAFLRSYDLNYRLRRLRFVQQKANQLFQFDENFRDELEIRQNQLAEIREKQVELEDQALKLQKSKRTKSADSDIEQSINSPEQMYVEEKISVFTESLDNENTKRSAGKTEELMPSEIIWKVAGEKIKNEDFNQLRNLRLTVSYFQKKLNEVFIDLQKAKEGLISRSNGSGGLTAAIRSVKLSNEDLNKLLEINDFDIENQANQEQINEFLQNKYKEIYQPVRIAADELKKLFDDIFENARQKVDALFEPAIEKLPNELEGKEIELTLFKGISGYLRHFYKKFDEYDQISFPALYETEVGESVKVDVLRISPIDAKFLIDEENVNEKRRKLAGTSLYNFGAFIDRVWRKNDIMWGRLDGAERLITAVLPDDNYKVLREYFAEEMNRLILAEELMESDKEELRGLLAHSLSNASAGIEIKEVVGKIAGDVSDDAVKTRLTAVLRSCFDNDEIINFVKNNYEVERKTEPKDILRVISRATQVTGNIFEEIADKHGQSADNLRWISRLGQIFWGLVEVAAPNTIWNKVFRQWLKLFYAFEVILIVAATIFGKADLQQFSIIALVLTLIIHLTVLTLNDFMKGGSLWTLIRFLTVALFIVLCLTGALFIFAFFFEPDLWIKLQIYQETSAGFELWQKLFPASILIILFVAAFAWREFEKPNIRFIGLVTFGYVIGAILISIVLGWITQESKAHFAVWKIINPGEVTQNLGVILNLEFAKTVKDIEMIAGDLSNSARSGLKKALLIDSFLFIPLYTGFLIYFSRLLRYRRNHLRIREMNIFQKLKEFYEKRKEQITKRFEELANEDNLESIGVFEKFKNWLILSPLKRSLDIISEFTIIGFIARLTIFIIICAGLADLVENYFSYSVLQTSLEDTKQWMINAIRWSAMIKFGLLAVTSLIFSIIFLRGRKSWKILSGLLVLLSIAGFIGLIWHPAILIFMAAQIVILLIVSFVFTFAPNRFIRA